MVKIGDRNTYVNNALVRIDDDQPLPMLIGMDETLLKSMVPVRFIAEKLGYKVGWDDSTRTVLISEETSEIIGGTVSDSEEIMPEEYGSFGTVKTSKDDRYDYVYISTRYGISPKITRYSNPERVVFDFPDAMFTSLGGTLQLGGNCVEQVRYSNFENQARLVLDIKESTQAMVMSSEKGIMIRAEKSENDAHVKDRFHVVLVKEGDGAPSRLVKCCEFGYRFVIFKKHRLGL